MKYLDMLKIILHNEGGYANNKNDRGGETYRGISRKHHPGWIGWKYLDAREKKHGDIFEDLEQVVELFYFGNYYVRIAGRQIEKFHPLLALHLFDFAVNAGVGKATRMLQRIAGVGQDGIIGPVTLKAVENDAEMIYVKYYLNRIVFYRRISKIDNNKVFLKGWLKRVRDCSKMFYKEIIK